MRFIKVLLIILSLALLLSACKKEEEPPDDNLPPMEDEVPAEREEFSFSHDSFPRMDGSPVAAPLAQAVAAVMLGQSRQDVEERAIFTRTSEAFRNLANDLCDILIVGEPYPGVLDEISAQDFRYDIAPIALDALVFIVSASNPVDNISSEQAKSIYTGSITGWQQVGGDDIDIVAFQRNEEAMSQVLAEKLVMDWQTMAEAPMQNFLVGNDFADDSLAAIKGFDSSVNAIGYTMHYFAVNMAMAQGYKILSIDGVKPNVETIENGEYPFIGSYYTVINKDLPEDDPARILYNWLQAKEGQDFIASQGYVPVVDTSAEIRWDVKTDSSNLTPFGTPRSNFHRQSDAAMPELVPSDNYGTLLPYHTSVTMNDGSLHSSKYGFVTQRGGTIVTDPIYDEISRAKYYTYTTDEFLPAYHLHINLPDEHPDFGFFTMQAACALDGSWITPFEYVNIVFRDDVIFLLYDWYSFNIDVYDYSGNFLYNIMDLDWVERISEDAWPEMLLYSVNEGFGFIQLDDDTFAAMDVLTGKIRETNFLKVHSFSDGLAAVSPRGSNNLWGFVNKNLELVINPIYAWESVFVNNRAIVQTPDLIYYVINKQGETLFTAEAEQWIIHKNDRTGFYVHTAHAAAFPRLLTNDFHDIEYPAEAVYSSEAWVLDIGSGWYSCFTENGVWLISELETISMPSNIVPHRVVGDYIIFGEFNQDFSVSKLGVMTFDGQIIIEPESKVSIDIIATDNEAHGFIVGTDVNVDGNYSFIGDIYTRRVYRYIDPSGQLIKKDLGILMYDEVSGLLYAQGSDYFAWINKQGETLISIPSMAYTYD
ncbi:MAG: substrate-binding domain-containing protein [Oscillospiraceae bacterium]|nr:substrate-binding domain-containing protein [Oscillospiraceae bacterium]